MKTKELNQYEQQAADFLAATNTTYTAEVMEHRKYWPSDKETRDVYKCTLTKGNRFISSEFGQSIASKGNAPTAYDFLACIVDSNPGTFDDFCGDFGYDSDSRSAFDTYQKVVEQWLEVSSFYSESELELLREIN